MGTQWKVLSSFLLEVFLWLQVCYQIVRFLLTFSCCTALFLSSKNSYLIDNKHTLTKAYCCKLYVTHAWIFKFQEGLVVASENCLHSLGDNLLGSATCFFFFCLFRNIKEERFAEHAGPHCIAVDCNWVGVGHKLCIFSCQKVCL